MPHTSAADTRALRARRACTGEPRQVAQSNMPKASGTRQAIPTAATAAQQELEAHVLLALRDLRQLRNHDLPFYPFRYVTPKPDSLDLSLLPPHLGPLAFSLAPRSHDNEISGVPGLRMTCGRRGITLHLLGCDGHSTDANVLLKGVTSAQWSEAMSWVNDENGGAGQEFFVHEPALTASEDRFLSRYGRLRAHPMLASLVLRRLHLLSSARWIDVWTADSAIKIEWFEGPQLREVGRLLIGPDVGLLGEGVQLRHHQHELIDSDQEPYSLDFRGFAPQTDGTGHRRRDPEAALIMRRMD